jgi:hypothetical protein
MIALDLIKTLNKEGIHDIIVDDYEYEVEPIISLNSEVVKWWIESDDREGLIYTDVFIKTVDYDKQLEYSEEYYRKKLVGSLK